MHPSLGQRLLQQAEQGPIQPLEDAEHEQGLAKFRRQAPALLLQQLPNHAEVLPELQCPLQAGGQCTAWTQGPRAGPHPPFQPSPSHCFLFSAPEPDLLGEDVIKPGTQDGRQRLAQGRGLGLGWQLLQPLQHRLQNVADHQPGVLTRNAG